MTLGIAMTVDRPAHGDEIEVTPVMISAGVRAFYDDSDFFYEAPLRDVVQIVYRAMRRAELLSTHAGKAATT